MRVVGLFVLVIVVAGLWVVNCSGPRPVVTDVRLTPPVGPDMPYRLTAVIHNQGWGHGDAQIVFRLRDRATGRTIQEEQLANLNADETTQVTVELLTPPGDYEPTVEVDYPPR